MMEMRIWHSAKGKLVFAETTDLEDSLRIMAILGDYEHAMGNSNYSQGRQEFDESKGSWVTQEISEFGDSIPLGLLRGKKI